MKRAHFSRLVICMISLVLTAQSGVASEGDAGKATPVRPTASSETAAKTQPPTRSVPVYVPPRRGQPRARVGGGVRGSTTKTPTLLALAPDHVAHTARSQPTLLWHLDRVPAEQATLIFRFNITSDEEIDPLIAVVLERPVEPGIQRIDLSSYEFSLERGREYQWSVALVTDSEHPVRDVVTLGWIERVESGETRAEQANTDAAVLAAAGLWYDAVDVADGAERAALLDQIGLTSAQLP